MPELNEAVYEVMSTLRAVRRLKTDPIPNDVLGRILQAAAWAPSGGNVQPWRVVVVKDPEKRRALGDLYRTEWRKFGSYMRDALSKLTGDARSKQERMIAAADHLGEHLGDAPAVLIFCFNPDQMAITDADLGRPSVVGGGSVYPSVQNAMLACRTEGIGCTLTTLLCHQESKVREILELPDGWYTCAFIPIGYPERGGHGPISRKSVERLSFLDSWGQAFDPGA